jgi:GNAT superfamily N-acetyltransferase
MKEFFDAYSPHSEGPEILGYRLRPLALAHIVALEGIGSPFAISAAPDPDPADLVAFLTICSAWQWEDMGEALLSRATAQRRRELCERLAMEPRLFAGALGAVRAYWSAWFHVPPIMPGAEGRKAQTPWQLRAVVRATRCGYTSQQAWFAPMARVLWESLAAAELDGAKITLLDEETKASLRKLGHDV